MFKPGYTPTILTKAVIEAIAAKNGVDIDAAIKQLEKEALPKKAVSSVEEYPLSVYIWYKDEYLIDLVNEDLIECYRDPSDVFLLASEKLKEKWFSEEEKLLMGRIISDTYRLKELYNIECGIEKSRIVIPCKECGIDTEVTVEELKNSPAVLCQSHKHK
jgi:hypothetical protein